MTIKAHCMGMEFPKRDTDGPNVRWEELHAELAWQAIEKLPSAADLDAVAEEQRVKEKTGGLYPLASVEREAIIRNLKSEGIL